MLKRCEVDLMVVALLVAGALAMPVTGLLVSPDVHGARHGAEMIVELGRFGWYSYLAVSVVVLAAGLAGVKRGTPHGRRLATGATTALRTLTVVFGTTHVLLVATGLFYGEGRPLLAAVAAVGEVAAVLALVFARACLRRAE
jgi:hypothetical protein